ncbi:MAG: hypothetical protein A2064_05185 [Spirochaetes bacterium GWB1_66_5]|nr:MAG: hypothetical protein A2064_05185 [Spirochaetes bacterium GWB1_66_5]
MHRKLPLLGVVLAAGLFSIPAVFPAEHWAVFTDRRQNPLILEAMQSGDLADALETARALGRREDVYVADILSGLLSRRQELPILFLLRAVFPPAESSRSLSERLSANTQGLDELAEGLGSFSLALRREVVRLLRHSGNRAYDGQVLLQAAWLGERLRAQGGRAEAELAGLALEVLAYAESSAQPVFLNAVLRLQESSRSAPIAHRAAAVAAELAKGASGNPGEW